MKYFEKDRGFYCFDHTDRFGALWFITVSADGIEISCNTDYYLGNYSGSLELPELPEILREAVQIYDRIHI